MPSGLTTDQLIDLTRTTLENLPNQEFEVALDMQNYPVVNEWFKGMKKQMGSGTSIKRNIVLDTSGNARMVKLYQKTPINVSDIQKQIDAPWVNVQTHWSIERREAAFNRSPSGFVNLLKSRRIDATLDLAELLEAQAWGTPISSSDDLNAYGLPYWLSMLEDGATAAGFNAYRVRYSGGTSSTTKGGIDGSASANSKWRNYAFTRTGINEDFIKAMRKAFHSTRFVSPMTVKDLQKGPASNYRIYMGIDELTEYEDLVTQANDNLGRDLDPFHGVTTFKRVPIIVTPTLDDKDYAPIYAVNHSKFFPYVLTGEWMREDGPHKDVEQHNVATTFIDGTFNFFCTNVREGGFVCHTAIPS